MKVVALFMVALLAGCASQTIPPTYYLLRSNQSLQSSALTTSNFFQIKTILTVTYFVTYLGFTLLIHYRFLCGSLIQLLDFEFLSIELFHIMPQSISLLL